MVGNIQNKWLRRSLVVVTLIVFGTLLLVCRACELIFGYVDEELGDKARDAWEGPRRRG